MRASTTWRSQCGKQARAGRLPSPRQVSTWCSPKPRRHVLRQAQDEQQAEVASGADFTPHPEVMASADMPHAHLMAAAAPARKADSFTLDLIRLQSFEAYKRELQKPAHEVDLVKCVMLIAKATKYPEATVEETRAHMDKLAVEVEKQLARSGIDARYPMHLLRNIITVLYYQQGFHGNRVDYFLDDNSMLNCVLQDKQGIPISLSLLFMEVAARVGLPMKGVNLPGHFMIQPDIPNMEVLVDAFEGDIICTSEVEARVSQTCGRPVHFDSDVMETINKRRGVPPRLFLFRWLNNLRSIYLHSSEINMMLRIVRLMRVTDPDVPDALRDEGVCLYSLARYSEAAQCFNDYLKASPHAEDAISIGAMLTACQQYMQQGRK